MRQRAIVTKTHGKNAEIEVTRSSMCEGCEKNDGCSHHCEISGLVKNSGKMKTNAINNIGAEVGDIVEVETESTKVIGYAALVFIMPIIFCLIFYYAAEALMHSQTASLISSAAGFIISFVIIIFIDKLKRNTPEIEIVNILKKQEQSNK